MVTILAEYIKLAAGSLRRRKLRSWLTLIGIFIGIAAVVSLISLGEGLRNAVASQFSMLGSDIITVQASGVQYGPPGTGVVTPLKKDYADKIKNINGVKYAINRLLKSAKIEFNEKAYFTIIGSMPYGKDRKVVEDTVGLKAEQGRLLRDSDRYKIVAGYNFRDDDIFGKPVVIGSKITAQGKEFEVVGIAKKLGNFLMDNAMIANEDDIRDVFNDKEDVSIIVVETEKGANMDSIKENIEKMLRKERNVDKGEEDFTVELSVNAIKTLESTLFAVQLFVYIIAGISLIVGGIGIMNTMFTAVVERTKEIGIMKSIGATRTDIFLVFLVESGLLGIVGGIIGVTVGILLAQGLAFAGSTQLSSDLIHANVAWWLIFGSLLFSFVIGCIAGITPALRASAMHPVDALRYSK